jgi:hypothetical protein
MSDEHYGQHVAVPVNASMAAEALQHRGDWTRTRTCQKGEGASARSNSTGIPGGHTARAIASDMYP